MKLLVTGLNGTLAPRLAAAAAQRGWQVLGWDRATVDPEDAEAGQRWLDRMQPDAIAHLAMGSEAWAARLAAHAARRTMPFVFTSTAMVFHHVPAGPHRIDDHRSAQDDYGRYKIRCEDAVRQSYAGATVARIGWQIDADATGNNMLAQLDRLHAADGRLQPSTAWRPATSFMPDTAQALLALIERPEAGVRHLDSNAVEGHDFAAIVRALRTHFDRRHWVIEPDAAYRHDQRLAGGDARMPALSSRLPALAGG